MKKAIIVGGTSGIGKGLGEILTENNYVVGIMGRRNELLEEIKSRKPNAYFIKDIDVKEIHTIPEKLEELVSEMGGLDLLILSSGTGALNANLNFEVEKETIDTNVLGFTCIINWIFDFFEKQKQGHIAAISSVGGLRGGRQAPAYNATKAFQMNYLEALRQKVNQLKKPIYISDIRPGFVDTNMAKGDGQFWVASVDKACRQIYKAIKRKRKIVYITKRWRLIAVILKRIPRPIYDRM